jgi:hypothetical protein
MKSDVSGNGIRRQASACDPALQQVVSAANRTLRTKADTELVSQGIDLTFDAGIVATCRRCRISWRVSRNRFKQFEWWSCPSNCNREAMKNAAQPPPASAS